jgi:hypothetical protein
MQRAGAPSFRSDRRSTEPGAPRVRRALGLGLLAVVAIVIFDASVEVESMRHVAFVIAWGSSKSEWFRDR